jgi:hypothetical protein
MCSQSESCPQWSAKLIVSWKLTETEDMKHHQKNDQRFRQSSVHIRPFLPPGTHFLCNVLGIHEQCRIRKIHKRSWRPQSPSVCLDTMYEHTLAWDYYTVYRSTDLSLALDCEHEYHASYFAHNEQCMCVLYLSSHVTIELFCVTCMYNHAHIDS